MENKSKNETTQMKRLLIFCGVMILVAIFGIAVTSVSSKIKKQASKKANNKTEQSTTKEVGKSKEINEKSESFDAEEANEESESSYPIYIEKANEIPDDLLDSMKRQSEDVIKAFVAKNWDDEVNINTAVNPPVLHEFIHQKLDNLEYIGLYYLTIKPGSTAKPNNSAFLIYKIDSSIEQLNTGWTSETVNKSDWEAYKGNVNYYTFVRFDDLQLISENSGSVNLQEYEEAAYDDEIPGINTPNLYYDVSSSDYRGFTDLMAFENKYLVTEMDKYTFEKVIDETMCFSNDEVGAHYEDADDLIEATDYFVE